MTEEKEKSKSLKVTIALAAFAAITAVGDAARSYFERQSDVEAAREEAEDRIRVDTAIQKETAAQLQEIYTVLDEQDQILEEQDRAIWRLEREIDFAMRTVPAIEAEEAAEEFVEFAPEAAAVELPKPARRDRKRPKLDFNFVAPDSSYDVRQQKAAPLKPK